MSEEGRQALQDAFGDFPTNCDGSDTLQGVIQLWSDVLADVDVRASYADRWLVARSLFEQALSATDSSILFWFIPFSACLLTLVATRQVHPRVHRRRWSLRGHQRARW